MRKLLYISALFVCIKMYSQTITPQVINSAGDHRVLGTSGISVSDNVGEPFTETLGPVSNIIVTQGFLQPENITTATPSLIVIWNDVSCSDKKDGNISTAITNTTSTYTVTYIWSPSTVCPTGNCTSIDSLSPGNYSVQAIINNSTSSTSFTTPVYPITISDKNGPCRVKIYNAVTPNNDGNNDVWTIDNISEFPDNHVSIYNRWGGLVYETKGYNNLNKAWPQKEDTNKLIPSTYFYVLSLGNGTVLKGWIELIIN